MEKLREILEALVDRNPEDKTVKNILVWKAHSAILKLFKQEMLRLIGKDKDMSGEFSHDLVYRPPLCDGDKISTEYINYDQRRGYNQAKAELRKKVGEKNG